MADTSPPQGIALPPINDSFRQAPYPGLSHLRTEVPVMGDKALKRFIYSRHDEFKAILQPPNMWNDPRKAYAGTFTREFLDQNIAEGEKPSMLLRNEPDH